MDAAISNDEKAFATMLSELNDSDEVLLKEISELKPNELRQEQMQYPEKRFEPVMEEDDGSQSDYMQDEGEGSTGASRQQLAYEGLQAKWTNFKERHRGHPIVLEITDMEAENVDGKSHMIPVNHTFSALADTITNYDDDSFIPDFWSKETDRSQNRVTRSGVWWEWQDPSKKVIDAIGKEGHLGIEAVYKGVDYVVVLVKKGEKEKGMPIDVPRTCRQKAILHLQQRHFPNHKVSQVLKLQGDDASNIMFDIRFFPHKTNSLFVELQVEDQEERLVVELKVDPMGRHATSTLKGKGKGKQRPGPYDRQRRRGSTSAFKQ